MEEQNFHTLTKSFHNIPSAFIGKTSTSAASAEIPQTRADLQLQEELCSDSYQPRGRGTEQHPPKNSERKWRIDKTPERSQDATFFFCVLIKNSHMFQQEVMPRRLDSVASDGTRLVATPMKGGRPSPAVARRVCGSPRVAPRKSNRLKREPTL